MPTYYLNAAGSNTVPYDTPAKGATTLVGLFTGVTPVLGDTIKVCDEGGPIAMGSSDVTLPCVMEPDAGCTSRPILVMSHPISIQRGIMRDLELQVGDLGVVSQAIVFSADNFGSPGDEALIDRCIIRDTGFAATGNGSMYIAHNAYLMDKNMVRNCLIIGAGKAVGSMSAAIYAENSDSSGPHIESVYYINNTIVNVGATAIYVDSSNLFARNNNIVGCAGNGIEWGDFLGLGVSADEDNDNVYDVDGTAFSGFTKGVGSLEVDPLFKAIDDFDLQETSPLIDAADDAYAYAPTVDIEGRSRSSDIGAYEYTPTNGGGIMSSLSEIVEVTISRETAAVSQAGFGTPMVMGENLTTGRIAYVTTLAEAAAALDGGSSDPEYAAVAAAFSQNPRPQRMAIGHTDGIETVTAALDAILEADSDWYGLVLVSRTQQDQLDAAAWALANEKLFFTADDDADIIDVAEGAATDLAKQLKDLSNDRAAVWYHQTADGSGTDQWADSAAAGMILPRDPGSYTAKFKELKGVTVSGLTPTQSKNALDKNANVYQEIGGINMMREGTTAQGEYIDVMHFIDWLKARITENVFGHLVRSAKVPYTDGGIKGIEDKVKEILQIGQDRGGISPTAFDSDGVQIGGFFTSVPALEDIPSNDKANRVLNDVKFTAFLAGAIHKVVIQGIVTL
jgi:hypothetical protein